METIITAVLFSVPGFIVNEISERLFPGTKKTMSDIDKTVSAIINSSIVIIINLAIISILNKFGWINFKLSTFSILQDKLVSIPFFVKYILLTSISCLIWVFLNELVVKKLILIIVNFRNNINGSLNESKFETVWDEIFENRLEPLKNVYISIEKDGELITQGLIVRYTGPGAPRREFYLKYTSTFKEYLDGDKLLTEDKKLLSKIDREYFDCETGILIKFYNKEKFENYLKN